MPVELQILNFFADFNSWEVVVTSLPRVHQHSEYRLCVDEFQSLYTELARGAQNSKVTRCQKISVYLIAHFSWKTEQRGLIVEIRARCWFAQHSGFVLLHVHRLLFLFYHVSFLVSSMSMQSCGIVLTVCCVLRRALRISCCCTTTSLAPSRLLELWDGVFIMRKMKNL